MANPTVTLLGSWDSGSTSTSVTSKQVARNLAVTAGDLLLVCVLGNQNNNVSGVTDGQFGTLSTFSNAAVWDSTNSRWMQFFWATASQSYSASGTNNITASFSSGTQYAEVIARQFRCSTGYIFDSTANILNASGHIQNVAPGTGAGAILSGTTNFTSVPTLGFAASNDDTGAGGQTVANGWTSSATGNGGKWVPAWSVISSTGYQEATWTASASGGGDTYSGVIVSLHIITSSASVTVTSVNSGSAIVEKATSVPFVGTGFASGMTVSIVQSLNGATDATIAQNNPVYVDATDGQFDLVMEPGTGSQLAFSDAYYTHSLQVTISGNSGSGGISGGLSPPAGLLFVTLTSVNSVSSYRITATPDLVVNDQLEVAGDSLGTVAAPAGLTINADGTFQFAQTYPPKNFWVRAYDSTDQTWGGWAEQQVNTSSTVPDVSGQTVSAAEATLSGAGFSYWSISYEFSDTIPSGYVVSTLPTAGSSVPPTTDIILYVSSGVGPSGPPTPPQPVTTGSRELIPPTAMLSATIPSYLYQQYQDDGDLQAFVAAYNAATQNIVTWLAGVGLPYYPGLTGGLLDWVAEGIYGLERTSLAQTQTPAYGPFNTETLNSTTPAPTVAPPTASTPTSSGTTGLPAGTYYYVVTATATGSESVKSNEVSITTAAASDVTVTWTAVTGASGYHVYRGTASGSEGTFYSVSGGSTTSFTDTGAAGTSGTPPGYPTTLNAFTPPVTTYYNLTDDVFKRILTWNFYKGDGKRFCMKWLKRRVMRFLVGEDGLDPNPLDPDFIIGPENTQAVSATVSSDTLTVTINGAALSGLVQVKKGIPELFKAAFLGGVLDLPAQYTPSCSIVTTMTASVSPTSESVSGITTTLTTGTASVSALGGNGAYTYAWTWSTGGTGITINSPSSADTSFTASGMSRGTTLTGTAKCTITDTASHTSYVYVTVSIQNVSVPSLTVSPSSLSNSGTGSTELTAVTNATVSGGGSPYTYAWTWQSGGAGISITQPTGSSTQFEATGLSAGQTASGTAKCTVTDSYGQQATATCSVSLSRVTSVSASCSPTNETASASTQPITTGSTTVTASGGSAPYTYAWVWQSDGTDIAINSPHSATTNFTGSGMSPGQNATGTAKCTVTDALGQQATTTCSASITYLPPLQHTYSSGSGAETIPSNYNQVVIEGWAPGGGGAQGSGSLDTAEDGAGGGAGGYFRSVYSVNGQGGKTINWAIGATGTGGNTGAGSAGTSGGNTTVTSGTFSLTAMSATGGGFGSGTGSASGAGGPASGGNQANTRGGDGSPGSSSGGTGDGGTASAGVYANPTPSSGNGGAGGATESIPGSSGRSGFISFRYS